MQRRAAAIYAVFFLVVGAASYSLIATAESPSVTFENPDYRLQQGDTFSVGDQDYTVTGLEVSEPSGGGHGGGGGGGVTYSASVTNDPSEFVLQENINRTGILANDPQADNETVTRDGEEFVVITENGTSRLVAADEYFPEPNERPFSEGQQFPYQNNTATVDNVTNRSATIAWTAPRENTAEMSQANNVTLSGTTFLAYFPTNDSVVLTTDFQSYEQQTSEIDTFHERTSGLWGISILSGLVIVLLVGMAYLPSRY